MGLVKTRRLAAMHPPSRCALRRTGKQQRAIHLRRGFLLRAARYGGQAGGLKAGMKPPVKKGQWKGNVSSLIHAHLKSKMQNRWAIVIDGERNSGNGAFG